MGRFLRFACAGAIALTMAAVRAQDSPPAAPAPGRFVPTAPEAAPSTSAAAAMARKVPRPAGPSTTDEPGLAARAQAPADAEHQAARARCEAHPKAQQETCLREADESYERALDGENPAEQAHSGGHAGAGETRLD